MISTFWDDLDPGFIAPVWLLVGFVAVIAVALLEIGAYRRRRQAVRLFAASHLAAALTPSVSHAKRLLKSVLLVTAVGLLFVAMARPHLFYNWQDENRSGVDILIAVDCSKSMLTEDIKPNRIERAQLAIADFGNRLPDNRLGLIAFAGDAFLQCPLTLDHDAFEEAVNELDTDTIPRPGTDIATAIDLAVDALKTQPNNLKFLILVTDGEDLEGRVLDAAKNAAASGLRIYTVGVGTPEGDRIPERDESGGVLYHQDGNGQDVISKLDESTLRQIADITGGAYVQLGQMGGGLDEIYRQYIEPLPKQNIEEKREKIPVEQFEWPLVLATLLLILQFMIPERASAQSTSTAHPETSSLASPRPRRKRSSAAAALSVLTTGIFLFAVCAPGRAADSDNAERNYKAGQFEQAMQGYEQAAKNQPDRTDLQYNRGDAAYRAGEYSEAEDAYRQALETPDLNLQENAYYNLGNAQYQHGDEMQKVDAKKTMALWQQALHSYDSALKLRTTADARHNYEFVKKKLEELKQQQQQQQKNQDNQSDDNDQSGSGSQKKQQGQAGQGNNPQPSNQSGQNNPDGDSSSPNDKNGQGQTQANNGNNLRTYSGTRPQDQQDPNIKSRQEAENLLDSLKDDERHVTARTLNGDTQQPPPPSGRDW